MSIAPNIAGFLEAQDRLRAFLGQDVDFKLPQASVWPVDTPLDDDGTPYDPTIRPVSGGGLSTVTKHVGVIWRKASAQRMGAQVRFEPVGEFSTTDAILDLNVTDYAAVQTAVEVWIDGLKTKVMDMVPSGLGGIRRYLVYLEEK